MVDLQSFFVSYVVSSFVSSLAIQALDSWLSVAHICIYISALIRKQTSSIHPVFYITCSPPVDPYISLFISDLIRRSRYKGTFFTGLNLYGCEAMYAELPGSRKYFFDLDVAS